MNAEHPTDGPEQSLGALVTRLDRLIRSFEEHPREDVRAQVLEMLGLIDALHRGGVARRGEALWAGSPTVLEQAEAALVQVRPYIESHGGAVEILDVVEGVVHLRLSGACQGCAGSAMTLKRGIEAALRAGFPGFQGMEVHEPTAPPTRTPPANFIPLQAVGAARPLTRPVFTSVGAVAALPPGTLQSVEVDGARILLCNVAGEVYAYRNACPGSDLPLDLGQLKEIAILCPWHNCVFDARTGKRLDGGEGRLDVIPVAIRDGEIQLALNVAPVALG
jgi:Fe-S cluster biogenesis protein NfuA/nitrite reductase/ring-hydroxylating ferredoxin subunit